jgi:hypothetical protein
VVVVVVDDVVGGVAAEPAGGVAAAPGAGAAELSAGGAAAVAEASGVVVEDVEVVVEASGESAFLLQAPRAKLEAASTAAVAMRLVRQVEDVIGRLPREKTW